MTVTAQTLIAVALQLCPWQPAEVPPLEILPDAQFEAKAHYHGHADLTDGAFVLLTPPHAVFMRERAATDRLLCHEWRHLVEPEWSHD